MRGDGKRGVSGSRLEKTEDGRRSKGCMKSASVTRALRESASDPWEELTKALAGDNSHAWKT